jgi:two-component sensor histidine kinase
VESRWTGAELHNLVTQELSPYCKHGGTRVSIDGPSVFLEPNMAQTIAVCLHELATNAAKYGALSLPEGRIQIEWSRAADKRLIVRWAETGGPLVMAPTCRGFGTRGMEEIIRGQLKGEMRLDWRAAGLACESTVTIRPRGSSGQSRVHRCADRCLQNGALADQPPAIGLSEARSEGKKVPKKKSSK